MYFACNQPKACNPHVMLHVIVKDNQHRTNLCEVSFEKLHHQPILRFRSTWTNSRWGVRVKGSTSALSIMIPATGTRYRPAFDTSPVRQPMAIQSAARQPVEVIVFSDPCKCLLHRMLPRQQSIFTQQQPQVSNLPEMAMQ